MNAGSLGVLAMSNPSAHGAWCAVAAYSVVDGFLEAHPSPPAECSPVCRRWMEEALSARQD